MPVCQWVHHFSPEWNISPEDESYWLWWLVTLLLAWPAGRNVPLSSEISKHLLLDWHTILNRHLWYLDNESKWWRLPDFSSSSFMRPENKLNSPKSCLNNKIMLCPRVTIAEHKNVWKKVKPNIKAHKSRNGIQCGGARPRCLCHHTIQTAEFLLGKGNKFSTKGTSCSSPLMLVNPK